MRRWAQFRFANKAMTMYLGFFLLTLTAGQVVLNRIQSTSLGFADEICGNLTTFPPGQFEGCTGVDFDTAPNNPCIPNNALNCLVNGRATAFTNFTSDDAELPFNWLCGADLACGITTLDTNSTGGLLGSFNGSTAFGSVNGVVGFVDPTESMTRKVRLGGALVIDKRVEYVFSFDFCFANATIASQTVSLEIDIANATGVVVNNFASTSVVVPADADQSTCGQLLLRIPHYALFPHIGINGFAVTVANGGTVRVFIDNFRIQALPVISNDEGDTCQFPPAVVSTVVPAGTPACSRVFINEINYINVTFDGMSIDPTEAIEIAGPAGTVLTDMKIVLVNFVGNTPLLTTIVMGDQQGVVTISESPEAPGFGFVRVAISQGLPDGLDGIGIDGIALFQRETDTVPIQFVCFGLNANATNLPTVPFTCTSVVDLNNLALNDSTNAGSVHLVGCGNCYQDFDWAFSDPATTVNASGLPFQNTRQSFCRDQDADGYWEAPCCGGNDCNDLRSFIFPGAVEICDGELTNCIGPAVAEVDVDGDGRLSCDGDCDDNDITTFGLARFFVNGSIAAGALNCAAVPLTANNSQLEQCDVVDNDCDGLVNEAFVSLFHFRDNDFDGFADINADVRDTAEFPDCQIFNGCEVIFPRGWSPNRTDCDDSDPNVHPDGNSFCRINDTCEDTSFAVAVDNNCNGVFDEFDLVDLDGDGFANTSASANVTICPLRADAYSGGAGQQCFSSSNLLVNGGFENMDLSGWESLDQAGGSGRWDVYSGTGTFLNGFTVPAPMSGGFAGVTDQGGPGAHVLQQPFTVPVGAQSVLLSFDMFILNQAGSEVIPVPDSLDFLVVPNQHARVDIMTATAGAFSVASGDVVANLFIDGTTSSPLQYQSLSFDITSVVAAGGTFKLRFGEVDNQLFFAFGIDNVVVSLAACVESGGDCNDAVRAINPNATEVCNAIDDNCDGLIDENLFVDLDGDGFGDPVASNASCIGARPLNDCDDRNDTTLAGPAIGNFSRPDIAEVLCDGLDNDCNPATPDSLAETCDQVDTDCNCGLYNDPNITFVANCTPLFGDANETQFDNGIVFDLDNDTSYAFSAGFETQCRAAGYVFDCNDTNTAFPGIEVCDGFDNDCDSATDEGFFLDSDSDFWPDFEVNGTACGSLYNLTADCQPLNPAVNPGVVEEASAALLCNNINDDCDNATGFGSNGGEGALDENSSIAILFDGDGDGFRDVTAVAAICENLVLFDAFLNQALDCDDNDARRHPCRPDEFVCLTRIGGVKSLPCGIDEHRVCGRELVTVDGLIVADGIDNDCNLDADDLIEFAVHLALRGEFFDAVEATSSSSDNDDDDGDDDDSSSSKTDQFCADIKVTLTNDSPHDLKDIVIKGQLTLPPKGQLVEYILGDLHNFGIKIDSRTLRVAWVQFKLAAGDQQLVVFPVKIDSRTLRVAWVQFKLAAGDQQLVVFPVCVRSRENIFGVQLTLQLTDYSLAATIIPERFNLQTTIVDSSISLSP
jgi:hypothetical protein